MKTIRTLFATLSLCLSCSAWAGGSSIGPVTSIYSLNNGVKIYVTSGTNPGHPSCSTQGSSYAFDATTTTGKVWAQMLDLAWLTGKTVNFYGNGTCSAYPDRETLDMIIFTQ